MNKKTVLYAILLLVGFITFILQVFIFEAPDGNLGFVICMASVVMIVVSVIRMAQLNKKIREFMKEFINLFISYK